MVHTRLHRRLIRCGNTCIDYITSCIIYVDLYMDIILSAIFFQENHYESLSKMYEEFTKIKELMVTYETKVKDALSGKKPPKR